MMPGERKMFFIVACMVSYFTFVIKTVLISHHVLAIAEQWLNSIKAFSTSHPTTEQAVGA